MYILGLDLATVSSGVAILEDGEPVYSDTIQTPDSMKNIFERILFIQDKIIELHDSYKIDIVAIEDVPLSVSRNLITAKHLILLAGAVMGINNQRGATTVFLNPSEWRKAVGIFEEHSTREQMKREFQKAKAVELANKLWNLELVYTTEYQDKKTHHSDLAESALIALACYRIFNKGGHLDGKDNNI